MKALIIEDEKAAVRNLRSRWILITGSDIEIIETEAEFTVRLPLRKNETKA